jgi:hypothetical protein
MQFSTVQNFDHSNSLPPRAEFLKAQAESTLRIDPARRTMPTSGPLDFLPLWGLFLVTLALVRLAIEVGYRFGYYRQRRSEGEMETSVGAIVGATLGLLGFFLAFTFGLAATRFENRRQMVVEEANAIGTTYLRAGLLPDGNSARIRKYLFEYVNARLEGAQTGDREQLVRRSNNLQEKLWGEAEAAGKAHPDSIVVGLFIQALNDTIDVHSKRVLVALQSRLPTILWATLYLITFLTMAGVGYQVGLSKSKLSPAILVLILTFTAVMALVADLDRPREGMMTVSQQAVLELRDSMKVTP